MKSISDAGRVSPAVKCCGQEHLTGIARGIVRAGLVFGVGIMLSGCAMTQLGSMFSGSKEEVTNSIDPTAIPNERSLALAANDMAPAAAQFGTVGDCPPISIWQDNGQLTIYEIGRVGDSLAIKHRGEITKTARECEIVPGQVTVKYGVAGRVLLGPLGKSGPIKLPVLVHVTDRTRQKIKTTKLDLVVNLLDGKPYGNFSSVQSLSFPIEPGVPASQYSVFVTFDGSAPGAG